MSLFVILFYNNIYTQGSIVVGYVEWFPFFLSSKTDSKLNSQNSKHLKLARLRHIASKS